jgi:hypothetical protein
MSEQPVSVADERARAWAEVRPEELPRARLHVGDTSTPVSAFNCEMLAKEMLKMAELAEFMQQRALALCDKAAVNEMLAGIWQGFPRPPGIPGVVRLLPGITKEGRPVVLLSRVGTPASVEMSLEDCRELAASLSAARRGSRAANRR